jgi:hypothetical protein
MKGWKVESFPDLEVFHHRPTGAANNLLKHRFTEGLMDFSLGTDPAFEVVKCLRRLHVKPRVVGAAARFIGFSWSYLTRKAVLASPEFVAFLRSEQRSRLRLLSSRFLSFGS